MSSDPTELLATTTVLEISTQVSGGQCGRLLRLMGATVLRWDLPISADCPAELMDQFAASLHEGKTRLALEAESEVLDQARSVRLVVFDSLHDDAFDGTWTAASKRVLDAIGPHTSVIDVSGFAADITADPRTRVHVPSATITASAAAAMSWSIGQKGEPPLTLPYDFPDYLAGTEAAGAAVLDLLAGRPDGAASYWDVTATDVLTAYVGQIASVFLPYERPWHRDGARASMSGGFYPGAMFKCLDGWVTLVCRTNREWVALRAAMGNPEWSQRPEFADAREVARHYADEADKYLSAWTESLTRAEIVALGEEYNFPHALVLTVDQTLALEQFAHHGFLESDDAGRPAIPGRPWRIRHPQPAVAPEPPLALRPSAGKPLAGLRVLDLSWVWAGPMMTAQLADFGAEIIKIESTARPDPSRLRGKAIRQGALVDGPDMEASPYFNQMNRGKKSVGVNIGIEEGAQVVLDLVEHCDVVVENMRPGALDRRGLGYQQLAARRPGLIMVSMSMMGQDGPMRGVGGYAPIMSGLAGLDSIIGYGPDELMGLFNPALGDPNGAAHALTVLLAALVRRQRTGFGSWVDVAQIECLVSSMRAPIIETVARGGHLPVPANSHHRFRPHGTYRCAGDDSWISVAARTDRERSALAGVIDAPDTSAGLDAALAAWSIQQAPEAAARTLRAAKIPAAEVAALETVLAQRWPRARELYAQVPHRWLGPQTPVWNISWKRDGGHFGVRTSSPAIGGDTDAVLVELLKLSDDEIARLRALGAVE